MSRSISLVVGMLAAVAAWPALAQQPQPGSPSDPAAQAPPVLWTPVPRRVERREPTEFVPAPSDINVPARPPPPPPIAGAAATRGSAVAALPEGDETTYHRPTVVDPGSFQAGDTLVRFAGIAPLSIEEHCPGASGEAWPCGRRALAALRDLVRQRPLHCVETGRDGVIVIARCRVGRTDVSAWLVERGWARPAGSDERLQRLLEAAREGRVGQFAMEAARAPPP